MPMSFQKAYNQVVQSTAAADVGMDYGDTSALEFSQDATAAVNMTEEKMNALLEKYKDPKTVLAPEDHAPLRIARWIKYLMTSEDKGTSAEKGGRRRHGRKTKRRGGRRHGRKTAHHRRH